MRFEKPALTLEQQVAHLVARGMTGDPDRMADRLATVNYYRLSAYWHTFRTRDAERFVESTDFEVVWQRYVFDRELRVLVMDAVERVEVAVRARLAYAQSHAYGPFGYVDNPSALFRDSDKERCDFIDRQRRDVKRSHEPFVAHFKRKYGDTHTDLPEWVATEVMSFGGMLSLYRGSPPHVRKEVARHFGVAHQVLESWLRSLNAVRNMCAHHARFWNRVFGLKPKLPREPEWRDPVKVGQDRAFAQLTVLVYLLHRVAPGSHWANRLDALFRTYPDVPTHQMGFSPDWKRCPIWARMLHSPLAGG